jgi:DNA-binding response OmpR family regulator
MSKKLILCVDDDQDTREMMKVMLSLEGYEVIATGSVAEAIHLAIVHSFDLFLLDWLLKDGTGIELCKALRSMSLTAPILFSTGLDTTDELLNDVTRAGGQGVLTKPVHPNIILQRVSSLLGD